MTPHYPFGGSIRLSFEMAILRSLVGEVRDSAALQSALLDGVSELVREKILPAARVRLVLAGRENNVLADRVGMRVDIACGLGCCAVIVDADRREVVVEA